MNYFFSTKNLLFALLFSTLSLSASAQHIVKTVPVGSEPRGVAVNAFTDTAYVANVHSGTISVLRHGLVIKTLPVDTLPFEVTIDVAANKVYAAGCNFFTGEGSKVAVLDGRSNQLTATISLNNFCGLGVQGITVNPLTHRVFVSDYDDNQEVVIDGNTNQIVDRIDLQGRQGLGQSVDLVSNQVWVTLDGPGGNVDIIDGASNTILQTISVGNFFLSDVAINNVTRRAYVTSSDSPDGLSVFDVPTRQKITTVPTGNFNTAIDVDPITNLIFVTDANANNLSVVDGRKNTVRAQITLSASAPNGVAVNPVTRIAYVTEFDSTQVQLISEF